MIQLSNPDLFLIAGPCVVESAEISHKIASKALQACDEAGIRFIFKASYRKANRTKANSFTGLGNEQALEIIAQIGAELKVSTLTDVHSPEEAVLAAQYVDVLQIPAFLCRQTDLLIAAAQTGKIINIKKGQFMSALSMQYAVEKVRLQGNNQIILTERGNMFGYNDLIVDFRNIPIMKSFGVPVVLDVTHALQKPNQESGITGGQPDMIETLAKAGIAAGVNGIFLETHPNPQKALSDGANMLPLDKLPALLKKLVNLKKGLL